MKRKIFMRDQIAAKEKLNFKRSLWFRLFGKRKYVRGVNQ